MDCPIHKGYYLDEDQLGIRGFCGPCNKWYKFPEGGRFHSPTEDRAGGLRVPLLVLSWLGAVLVVFFALIFEYVMSLAFLLTTVCCGLLIVHIEDSFKNKEEDLN